MVTAPPDELVSLQNGAIALSPDGSRLATVILRGGDEVLSIYDFRTGTTLVLDRAVDAAFPCWSPDSRSLAFFADEKLWKMDASGGPPMALAPGTAGRGVSWGANGALVFAPNLVGPLMRVSANGGDAAPVTTVPSDGTTHRNPSFLPDGTHFLFIERIQADTVGRVLVGSLDGGPARQVLENASAAHYANGHLLFVRDGTLVAQRFDVVTQTLEGDALPVVSDVSYYNPRDLADFSVAPTGLLAYASGTIADRTPAWVDADGTVLEAVGATGRYVNLIASQDLRRIAATRFEPIDSAIDLWLLEGAALPPRRLTFTKTRGLLHAAFSADGEQMVVSTWGAGAAALGPGGGVPNEVWVQPVTGARGDAPLFVDQRFEVHDWSPDGTAVLGSFQRQDRSYDVVFVRPDEPDHPIHDLVTNRAAEWDGRFSPDGRFVVYASEESGRAEVYIVDFPAARHKVQVSRDGAIGGVFAADGRSVVFGRTGEVWRAPVTVSGDTITVGDPLRLELSGSDVPVAVVGDRYLVLRRDASLEPSTVHVVRDWTALLPPPTR